MDERILRRWDALTPSEQAEGRAWYPDARRRINEIAKHYDLSPFAVAGVTSALSPQFAWRTFNSATGQVSYPNLTQAIKAINMYRRTGKVEGVHFKVQCAKAQAILEGHKPLRILRGPKTRAFYHNLAYANSSWVTIDRWAWRVACEVPYRQGLKLKDLLPVQDAYRRVANQVGEIPSTVQAGTWIHIRKED